MPIFEYECQECGNVFEILAGPGEAAPQECPQCGARKVQRKISVFSDHRTRPGSCAPRRG